MQGKWRLQCRFRGSGSVLTLILYDNTRSLRSDTAWYQTIFFILLTWVKEIRTEITYYAGIQIQYPNFGGDVVKNRRMQREADTMEVMIRCYCRDLHGQTKGLCHNCQQLLNYAHNRLQHCPFQEGKTTCANCSVHCYNPAQRNAIREIMRYVGPRMLLRHPLLSIKHSIDGWRKTPVKKRF